MSSGGNNDPGQQNAFEAWQGRTPPVTRYVIGVVVGMYILTFVASNALFAFANIPLFVLRGEIWRLLFPSFFSNGIFSVLFICMTFNNMGKQLESAVGSLSFAHLVLSTALLTNLGFFAWSLLLAYNPIIPVSTALVSASIGLWPVILALVVVECSMYPASTRQLLFFPVQIPTKYYPLALLCFFFLFSFSWDLPIGLALGYLRVFGWLKSISPSVQDLRGIETRTASVYEFLVSAPGYVSVGNAMGGEVFGPSTPEGGDENRENGTPAMSFPNPWGSVVDGANSEEGQFPGTGVALANSLNDSGNSETRSLLPSTDRQARARAAERAALARAQRFGQGGSGAFQYADQLKMMENMGYKARDAKAALQKSDGNVDNAVALLIEESEGMMMA